MRRAAAVAVLVLSAPRTGTAGVCAARAEVTGDHELATRVSAHLSQLGAGGVEAPGCPPLRAAVARDPSGAVAVTIRDRDDRIEGRIVDDDVVAAVWIDSWLHDDLDAPLWAAPAAGAAARPKFARSRLARLALTAGYESTFSDDGTRWSGIGGGASVALGPIWLGLRGRISSQGAIAASGALTAAERGDLVVLATAATTVRLGSMAIAPELGLGVGAMSTRRIEGCKPIIAPVCDPTNPNTPGCTPMCAAGDPGYAYVGDNFATTRFTPRVAAAVAVSLPLIAHVWLDGRAALEAAPGRHGDAYAATPAADGSVAPLPGEPLASIGLTIGLRVGGR